MVRDEAHGRAHDGHDGEGAVRGLEALKMLGLGPGSAGTVVLLQEKPKVVSPQVHQVHWQGGLRILVVRHLHDRGPLDCMLRTMGVLGPER